MIALAERTKIAYPARATNIFRNIVLQEIPKIKTSREEMVGGFGIQAYASTRKKQEGNRKKLEESKTMQVKVVRYN